MALSKQFLRPVSNSRQCIKGMNVELAVQIKNEPTNHGGLIVWRESPINQAFGI